MLTLITDCRRACPDARTDRAVVTQARRWLDEAIAAGVDRIQLREPWLDAARLAELAGGLQRAADGSPTRIVINDRADVARAVGVPAVHLRDDGWPVARVRALFDAPVLVGQSIHDAGAAARSQADYVHVGAVFGSGDKPAGGLDLLRAVAAVSRVPVHAVGGVTPANAATCRAAGAAGVAAITVFLPAGIVPGALGPREAVARLRYS